MPSSGKRLSVRIASLAVGRRAPDALAGDAHGAEAEPIDLDVAADREAAGLGCVDLNHLFSPSETA